MTTARFPEPALPIRPILSFGTLLGGRDPGVPSIEDAGTSIWVTSGRIALALGLEREGIGHGDEVLLPAYNCVTMVDAIRYVGAIPVYYRSGDDLSPDLDDARAKISSRTRAILIVHFFGFPQDIDPIDSFRRAHSLVLIEDCAHSYFGQHKGRPLGSFGDFAISSAMKFFPVSDGGGLTYPGTVDRDEVLHSAGTGFEAKSIVNSLERSIHYSRLQPFTWLLKLLIAAKDLVWNAIKRRPRDQSTSRHSADDGAIGPQSLYGGYSFESEWMHVRMSWFSRFVVRCLPRSRMIAARRSNYVQMAKGLEGIDGARPLFRDLPDDVVPYVFPFLIDDVDRVFPVLKAAGVPILRWEEIDESVCDVSTHYSTHLLQLPCHQEVSQAELQWIVRQIKAALNSRD